MLDLELPRGRHQTVLAGISRPLAHDIAHDGIAGVVPGQPVECRDPATQCAPPVAAVAVRAPRGSSSRYCAVAPRSGEMGVPVMVAAASLHRKATTPAISEGSISRGCRASKMRDVTSAGLMLLVRPHLKAAREGERRWIRVS